MNTDKSKKIGDKMEIPKEIYPLIEGSEKIDVEYKENLNKSEIKESMVGFANYIGGKILVGVKEVFQKDGYQKGKIVG